MQQIYDAVINGEVEEVESLVQAAVDSGDDLEMLINDSLVAAMDEVGARMRSGDMFVPEVLIAAEAMKAGLNIIKPLLGDRIRSKGTVLLGTVAGDLHDIGKNLVGMLLESSGYTVVDLGVDVASDKFLQGMEQHRPDIIGLSALLTTTMQSMEETVQLVKEKQPSTRVIIGGAPISREFADEIGADGYGPDAAAAVDLCDRLIKG